jgi:23S rRNA (pseudouridine1915-N3)-methyltransferase
MRRPGAGAPDLALLWVGRRPARAWEELAGEYAKRVSRLASFIEVRVKPAGGRDGDPARALTVEADALRRHINAGDHVVALDERGVEPTTEELTAKLRGLTALGRRATFVIGSDLGLARGLCDEASERLALSRLTLPHALVRVLVLEQLYRACDLLAGGSYHRSGS